MVLKAIFVGLLLPLGTLSGAAAAASSASAIESLVEIGGGELTWFGLSVYEARLYNSTGRVDQAGGTGPLALEITYRRNVSRERLVRTTEREWGRLGQALGLRNRSQVEAWLGTLEGIWPDVAPGDRIVALVEPGGPTRFYGNGQPLGDIADPRFGPAFLGIWLHPDTRAPELRAELLGEGR
jgi:hypothetical protein